VPSNLTIHLLIKAMRAQSQLPVLVHLGWPRVRILDDGILIAAGACKITEFTPSRTPLVQRVLRHVA